MIVSQIARTPGEVQAQCPTLDMTCVFDTKEYAQAVLKYQFGKADLVPCQMKKNGERCGRNHASGWAVRRRDGRIAYVGEGCARENLKALKKFRMDARGIAAQIRLSELRTRLTVALSDACLSQRISALSARLARLHERIVAIQRWWPLSLKKRIAGMHQGTPEVTVELAFAEQAEGGTEIFKWRLHRLGAVVGVEAMDLRAIRALSNRLDAAAAAATVREVDITPASEAKLKRWLAELSDVAVCESTLNRLEDALASFLAPCNLKLLYWTVRGRREQLYTLAGILRLLLGMCPTEAQVREAGAIWKRTLCTAHDARDLRVP